MSASARPIQCDAGVERTVVDRLLDQAQAAVTSLDPEALQESIDKTHLLVRCVEVVLDKPDIARLYRLTGISRYVSDDLVGATLAFEVAKAVAPEDELDEALGAPLRMTYDAVPPATHDVVELPRPSMGWLSVDGEETLHVPTDRGYFLQWVGKESLVRGTWMVAEGGVPGYAVWSEGSRKVARPLRIAGIATFGAGVAAYAAGALAETADGDDGYYVFRDGLLDLGPANRGLVLTGAGLGVVGAGLFGVSFAVGR